MGSVSLGYGPDGKRIRRKVFGKTKQEVRDRLKALHQEMNAGVRSSRTYTLRETVEDWLSDGLDGTSERTRTLYEGLLEPVLEMIGARPLRDLSAGDVRSALGQLVTRYSTRSLQITRNSLERAIRHAEANDLVGRNVAALVKPPRGRTGRPSKSLTLDQAKRRAAPGPYPPDLSRCACQGRKTPVPRVLLSAMLAGPAPSGSTGTSRLCQGCSHPPRHHPDQAALSYSVLLRQDEGEGLSPPLDHQRLTAQKSDGTGQRLPFSAVPGPACPGCAGLVR